MDDSNTRTRLSAILTALAEGVHPLTGEVFPEGCAYHSAEIVRALYTTVRILESPKTPGMQNKFADRPRDGALANVGKPWSSEEDRQLLVEFDAGKSLKECATLHLRTVAGIEARLEKLGALKAEDRTTSRRYPPASRGTEAQGRGSGGPSHG
jgi:hypothetical protein